MSGKYIGVKPNDLDIKKINPKNHPRYSPNLYKWIMNRNNPTRKWASRVYKDSDGTLWIGFIDDGDFIGARLMSVLCNGSGAWSACYGSLKLGLVEVIDFWDDYIKRGRCAIDQDHSMYFIGDETRWRAEGDTRECLWCGNVRQRLKKWSEVVEREKWVTE